MNPAFATVAELADAFSKRAPSPVNVVDALLGADRIIPASGNGNGNGRRPCTGPAPFHVKREPQ